MRVYQRLSMLLISLLFSIGAGYCQDKQALPLKGTVNVNLVQVEESLAQLDSLTEKIRLNSEAATYQLTRKHIEHVASPNFVGSAVSQIVIPPVPQPDGSMRMGALRPISKPVFQELLSDLREQVVQMRKTAVVLHNWPVGLDKEVAEPWKQTSEAISELVTRCNKLIQTWSTDKNARDALGKELVAIHDQCQKLEKPLDEVARIVKDYDRSQKADAGKIEGAL